MGRQDNGLQEKHKCSPPHTKEQVVVIVISDWFVTLKAKKKTQQDLATWTDEEWGSSEQHSAKEKGKKAPSKTKGRYMPKATYKRTPKSRLKYQDRKKRKGRKKGKQNVWEKEQGNPCRPR